MDTQDWHNLRLTWRDKFGKVNVETRFERDLAEAAEQVLYDRFPTLAEIVMVEWCGTWDTIGNGNAVDATPRFLAECNKLTEVNNA